MLKHLSTESRRKLVTRVALKKKNPGKIRLSVFRSGPRKKISKVKVGILPAQNWLAKRLQNARLRRKSPIIAISIVAGIVIMVA